MVYKFTDIVVDSRTGLNPRKNFILGNGDNYYITIKDIYDNAIHFTDKTDRVDDNAIQIIKRRSRIKNGDILFISIGRIGETAIVTNKDDSWDVNESVFVFTLNDRIITSEYFCLMFHSHDARRYLADNSSGSTFKSIKMNQLERMSFDLPSVDEQKAITDKINLTKAIISLHKQQLQKLDELVKSRFIELFGDVINVPKYSSVPLGTICSTLSGGTPTTKVPEYYQGNIPWISTPFLGNNHINGSSAKAYITEEAIKNSATHLIPANTIMFGIRVGVGKSSIIDEPMCANQDIVALMGIDLSKYNLLFIKHVLDAYQSHFDSIKKGATILGITTDDLKKVLIPCVDIELQNQFADFVSQVDKLKVEVQKSLDETQLLFDSLMQEYFG